MTRDLLDTNIVSDLIRNPRGKTAQHLADVGEAGVCTSIIVAAELRYGSARNGSRRLLEAVEDLLGEIDVLAFESPADITYGEIRSQLEAAGKLIGSNDLLIAAHALAVDAIVVTGNADEFRRVRGLKVQNWLE